jgi:hypothetical protein
MNLTNANTEPYYQFHRRCEEFDRTMRITVAGLAYVRQQQRTADGPVRLPTDGEPFGDNLWNQPGQKVLPAKRLLAHMGVAHIITLLEDFCVGIKAEHDRFTAISGQTAERQDANEDAAQDGLSPKSLYSQLRFQKDTLHRVEPLYEYFVKVRNCVVHRSGRTSKDLHRYASHPKLLVCVEGWKGPRGKMVPALPAIILHEEIAILPRHAILASEVCRTIARDANAQLIRLLGEDGMVSMAAFYSLLAENPIRTAARNSPQSILNYLATDRYRIGLATTDEAVRVLARTNRWKPYLRRFERLKAVGRLTDDRKMNS